MTQNNTVLEEQKTVGTDNLKFYAAFRSGCLGENILNIYFSFFANIIIEEGWQEIEANNVSVKFKEKYNFPVPLTFVRQVLGIGIQNGSIINVHGRYEVVREKINQFKADMSDFESSWKKIINDFSSFCSQNNYAVESDCIENRILDYIDRHDSGIVLNRDVYSDGDTDPFDYAWNKYLREIATSNQPQFDFISEICFSNILRQAIFYTESAGDDFKGLCVYLDSPLVFAVLGMDDSERVDSARYLIHEMQKVGCNIQILDHNFSEVLGIITNASGWATSTKYDISKANNVARFFHDNQFDGPAVADFCIDIQRLLSEYGITIKETEYDVLEHQFQEDESLLYSMVEEKYRVSGYLIPAEKQDSIRIDVRSIIMLYRMRQMQVSQTIQQSKHIMLTLNGAIANVCKKYESNKSANSGHIPVCISADLFGTVLWMFHPDKILEYYRKRLLADCYSILRPSKKMLEKYVESLNNAKAMGEIDEKRYLFMRSHAIVSDALMNVTKGDYARFNDRTYLEVYEQIVASSDKKYKDEAAAHAETKKQLEIQIAREEQTQERLKKIEAREEARVERNYKILSWVLTIIFFGIPYIVLLGIFELLKSTYHDFSLVAITSVSTILVLAIILDIVFKKVNVWMYNKVREHKRKTKYKG